MRFHPIFDLPISRPQTTCTTFFAFISSLEHSTNILNVVALPGNLFGLTTGTRLLLYHSVQLDPRKQINFILHSHLSKLAVIALPSMKVTRLVVDATHRTPYPLSAAEVVMTNRGIGYELNKMRGLIMQFAKVSKVLRPVRHISHPLESISFPLSKFTTGSLLSQEN